MIFVYNMICVVYVAACAWVGWLNHSFESFGSNSEINQTVKSSLINTEPCMKITVELSGVSAEARGGPWGFSSSPMDKDNIFAVLISSVTC